MRRRVCVLALLSVIATATALALAGLPREAPGPLSRSGWGLTEWFLHLARERAVRLDALREYASRGQFPRNYDIPEGRIPVFIDEHGTHCAVGYLMERSGSGAEARRIARADNHVRVMNVSTGPLVEWILTSGLTQEECARIQPGYGWERRNPSDWGPIERDSEVARLRAHFRQVEIELRAQTLSSLRTAMERLLPRLRPDPQGKSFGFVAGTNPQDNQGWRLESCASVEVSIRATPIREDGTAAALSSVHTLPVGASVDLPRSKEAFLLVEWRSDADVQGAAVRIAAQ